jgi:hypothetical protein
MLTAIDRGLLEQTTPISYLDGAAAIEKILITVGGLV